MSFVVGEDARDAEVARWRVGFGRQLLRGRPARLLHEARVELGHQDRVFALAKDDRMMLAELGGACGGCAVSGGHLLSKLLFVALTYRNCLGRTWRKRLAGLRSTCNLSIEFSCALGRHHSAWAALGFAAGPSA